MTDHLSHTAPATPGWPDRAIAELAARQATIVARAQLLTLGVSPAAVSRALARGRLHRVHRGVYSLVAPAARPPLAPEHAALLVVGPEALLSHATAARLHGLPARAPREVHVTHADGHRRSRRGLRCHRATSLPPGERRRAGGLPVTSIPRTVLDLAPSLGDRALEHLLDAALARVSRAGLRAAVDRRPAVPGARRLRVLLDPQRPSSATRSRAEERLLGLIRRAGLPAPEVNVALGPYVPDLLWREPRLVVEFDSVAHHAGPGAFHADRDRHNALTAQGFTILHVTWRQLTERPEQVLVWVAVGLSGAPPAG